MQGEAPCLASGAETFGDAGEDAARGAQLGNGEMDVGIGGQAGLDGFGCSIGVEPGFHHQAHIGRSGGGHDRQLLALTGAGFKHVGGVAAEDLEVGEGGLGQFGQGGGLGEAVFVQRYALAGGALDRVETEAAADELTVDAATGKQGQQQVGVVSLSAQTVQMDRREGEVDTLQDRVQQVDLIGPQAELTRWIEPQFEFGDAAHQVIQGRGIGGLGRGFDQGLANAPGQVNVARRRVDRMAAFRAREEGRAALDPVDRGAAECVVEIGAAQGFLCQGSPAGRRLGREIPGEGADSVSHARFPRSSWCLCAAERKRARRVRQVGH